LGWNRAALTAVPLHDHDSKAWSKRKIEIKKDYSMKKRNRLIMEKGAGRGKNY